MGTPKVILFYAFAPLPDPDAVRLWQHTLASSLGLKGRVIISRHGINGTLGGDVLELKKYVKGLRSFAPFRGTDIKWSAGEALPDGSSALFPRLSVKVRDEIVTFGAVGELEVDADGVVGGAPRLTPEELHALVEREDVVFLDGRNSVEAQVGRFKGAVVPGVEATREFVDVLESGALDHLKDKTVVTYCTGGIRCEVLTPLMRNRGFTDVYQLDGGIARYGEAYGDDGLWEGSLYVFDARDTVEFSDHAAVVGRCDHCGTPTKDVVDCADGGCVRQMVRCPACATTDHRCDRPR
ncbi:hypothetical protein ASD11_16675 [Aeromicrobium sp. Root495]|uniref:oxygen-dependent tRNA uridine(34) hydroxylase TrhO n=1 Tax=Aeromicrobium sp. Root495 TaxID=1736550 RepID=UPI0006FAE957|nr:rhodanese-related sulfurtransferase [Aeromicrobium sp. Root495]KQY56098.1 hypothetical protein ASD11_16675 [Aeromicrobium sp. Root495]